MQKPNTNTVEFEEISIRNFLSVGDAPLKIKLNRSPTTLVRGKSGSGKSAIILDSLTFALYGKPFRNVNKPTLVNTVNNKNCVVEILFRVRGGKQYKVVRGIKPSVFEIYEDGKLVNITDATKDYQTILVEEILKIKENVFRQIVVLGSATFVPFMNQPAAKRREIIEDILDTRIFSQMAVVQKEKLDAMKAEMRDVEFKLDVAKEKIDVIKAHRRDIEQQSAEKIEEYKSKIFELTEQIEAVNDEIEVLTEQKNKLVDEAALLSKKSDKTRDIEAAINTLKADKKRTTQDVKFLSSNAKCPTCHQDIDPEHKEQHVHAQTEVIAAIDKDLAALAERLIKQQDANDLLSKVNKKIQSLDKQIIEKGASLRTLENQKQFLLTHLSEKVLAKDEAMGGDLEAAEAELEKYREKVAELLDTREYLSYASAILKDGGIKTKIVKQYLPEINKDLNRYLEHFGLFVGMHFDSEFNETFTQNYREVFAFNNFSEGEKARVSLAIILAFRELAKKRHSVSCNLWIIDEVFQQSLDGDTIDLFLELLRTMGEEGSNIFVVSHSPAYQSLYSTITVERSGHFTKIV